MGKIKQVLILIMFFAVLLAFPGQALANGGPIKWAETTVPIINMWPLVSTNIEVSKEDLTLDLTQLDEGSDFANISAKYTLFNAGNNKETVTVGFPVPKRTDEIEVYFAEKDLEFERVALYDRNNNAGTMDVNLSWFNTQDFWVDPVTLERYKISSRENVNWWGKIDNVDLVIFQINLDKNAGKVLEVKYPHYMSKDRTQYITPIYHLTYWLEPASYWADFSNLNVKLVVPKGWKFASDPVLNKLQLPNAKEEIYVGSFAELPGKILSISAISTKEFWLGKGKPKEIWLIIIISAFIIGYLRQHLKEIYHWADNLGKIFLIMLFAKALFNKPLTLVAYPLGVFQHIYVLGAIVLFDFLGRVVEKELKLLLTKLNQGAKI